MAYLPVLIAGLPLLLLLPSTALLSVPLLQSLSWNSLGNLPESLSRPPAENSSQILPQSSPRTLHQIWSQNSLQKLPQNSIPNSDGQ